MRAFGDQEQSRHEARKLWQEVINKFGDAIQHRPKRCSEEAHDGSAREELFLALRKDVGIRKISSSTKGPWVGLAKLFADLGDGVLDDVIGAIIQFAENHRVGEGFGEALVIDHRAEDSEGCSIVENGLGKESFESYDVFVGDVVPERGLVRLNGPCPKIFYFGMSQRWKRISCRPRSQSCA